MLQLSFTAKLAFICNICFAITFITHFVTLLPQGAVNSSVIIIGQLFAVFINLGINAVYWVARSMGRRKALVEPRWLVGANLIFLLLQGYYYFFFQL